MGSRTALVKAYGSSSEAAPFGVIPFALHPGTFARPFASGTGNYDWFHPRSQPQGVTKVQRIVTVSCL